MRNTDRHRLLHGPYHPPALRRGDRATCLLRDAEVVITGWSAGRIAWPRCQRLGTRGGSGLLVDEELARAVRLESSLAIQHWWGVSGVAVWHRRKALGVEKLNEGSARLRGDMNRELGDGLRGKMLPPGQVERRQQTARKLGLWPTGRWKGRGWTKDQLRLLGKLPDGEVAKRTSRSPNAVRVRRTLLAIPIARDRRRR